jgi:pimeloyl-ACP methyl ester carboxylesterase
MSDTAVAEFLSAMKQPPRRRVVPRVAERLRQVEMHELDGPQGRIAAWRIGEGPAVLLVHGFEDDNTLWTPMIDALMARGTAIVVLDLPGHGLSDGDDGFSPAGADAIKLVATALGPIEAIVGHSLGCWASALAIAEGVTAQRFVLIAPPGGSSHERWRRAAERMGYADDVADRALAVLWRDLGPARGRELQEVLSDLSPPLLFVHSQDDERAPLSQSRELCDGCADARLFVLTGPNHRATAQDSEALAAIITFLER